VSAPEPIVINVAAGLAAAGKDGERRSIHRRPYRRAKPIAKRPSMLDRHRAEIDAWLEADPTMTAVDVRHALDLAARLIHGLCIRCA
jgi:hypothetical protein